MFIKLPVAGGHEVYVNRDAVAVLIPHEGGTTIHFFDDRLTVESTMAASEIGRLFDELSPRA